MINFFTDLDSTLVYSRRHTLPEDSVVVEYLYDRIQSRMTRNSYEFFKKSKDFFIVPTTSRTCEQYSRLADTLDMFGSQYALVCNGGVLLHRNEIDADWLKETKDIAGDELVVLDEVGKIFRSLYEEKKIHSGCDVMMYAVSENPKEDCEKISKSVNSDKVNFCYDSRKVYCIPVSVNKGNGVKRFCERMGITHSVSAGDSITDVPMLLATESAILPYELSEYVDSRNKYVADKSRFFSDYICDVLTKML